MASNDQSEVAKKRPVKLYTKVLDALATNKSVKGMTLQAIKRTIMEMYPEMQENFSNARLRTAMNKGLESTEIIRPKSSEEQGLKGYFLLNKALVAKKDKKKAPKPKKEEETVKEKKTKPVKSDEAKAVKKTKGDSSKAKTAEKTGKKVAKQSMKATPSKRPLKASISNTSRAATPRVREGPFSVTPKISKADKAGKRSKATAMKKICK